MAPEEQSPHHAGHDADDGEDEDDGGFVFHAFEPQMNASRNRQENPLETKGSEGIDYHYVIPANKAEVQSPPKGLSWGLDARLCGHDEHSYPSFLS